MWGTGRRRPKGGRVSGVASVVIALAMAGWMWGAQGALASSPPPAPNCTATPFTHTNSTGMAIPDANTTGITSSINVSGAGSSVSDVDVFTNITHTFDADLDMTLTSPHGTVVALTTDNGGALDNGFAGTLWDDQANPGSPIPYAAEPNQGVDNTYVNLTVAPSLTPEEPLSAFNGENPNGTWTLKIIDDAGGDTGALNSWRLDVGSVSPAVRTRSASFQNNTPVAIPDSNVTGITSNLNVSGAATYLSDLNATINITHTFDADLDMTLTSPAGTVETLTTDNGGALDNGFAGTTFDDSANPASQIPYAAAPNQVVDNAYVNLTPAPTLTPEEPLSAFNGQNPNGTWTLKVIDDAGGDIGTLNSWSLSVGTGTCNKPPVLSPIGSKTVSENKTLAFVVSSTDPDADPLTFSAGTLPAGATFNPATSQFTWKPSFSQAGTYPVHVEVSDGDATDSEDVTITVANVRRPTTTTVDVKKKRPKPKKPKKLFVDGRVAPGQANQPVAVTLLRKRPHTRHKGFKPVDSKSPLQAASGAYATSFKRPHGGKCKVTSAFAGTTEALGSSASTRFDC
jgi:subtilisin-like proprotein convertase family protein